MNSWGVRLTWFDCKERYNVHVTCPNLLVHIRINRKENLTRSSNKFAILHYINRNFRGRLWVEGLEALSLKQKCLLWGYFLKVQS